MAPEKIAAIMSSLGPSFTGKSPPKAPASRPSAHKTPGLGEKMRAETGKALESGLGSGRTFSTGLEELVKSSSEGVAPVAKPSLMGRAWGATKKPLALGALGAAGALAYGMHQQNQQNQRDHENQRLVYAPLQGAMM